LRLATLGQLEELLLMLSGDAGDDDADLDALPEPFADDQALTAVRNLWSALRPTQTAPGSRPGRLYAPDGHYEHIPLVPVQVDADDLDVLGATARGLGDPDRSFVLDDALEEGARIGPHSTKVALVEHIARLHGVLDLELTDDARTLLPRLQASLVETSS
jgi:hypothetical protein